jgi:hypothetical protein
MTKKTRQEQHASCREGHEVVTSETRSFLHGVFSANFPLQNFHRPTPCARNSFALHRIMSQEANERTQNSFDRQHNLFLACMALIYFHHTVSCMCMSIIICPRFSLTPTNFYSTLAARATSGKKQSYANFRAKPLDTLFHGKEGVLC